MSISTNQLLNLVEREYSWFDSLRRRWRQQFELKCLDEGRFERAEIDSFPPVKDLGGGKWAKFDLEDAFALMLALRIESSLGMNFRQATNLVFNASATAVITRPLSEPDLWIGFVQEAPEGRSHVSGTLLEITTAFARYDAEACQGGGSGLAFGCVNASAVFRELRERARLLDLATALGLDA